MKKLYKKICTFLVMMLFPVLLFSQSNQYLHFDKVDDYVQLDNASQYVLNATGLSLTGWFYTDALAYGQGMFGFRSGNQGFYMIILNNGTIECRLRSSTGLYEYVAPANSIVPQMWQHVAWIYDGTTVKLYVNDTMVLSANYTGTPSSSQGGIRLMRRWDLADYWGGRLATVDIYDIALDSTKISSIWNSTKSRFGL